LVALQFVPTFPTATCQSPPGFALDPPFANQAMRPEEAIEASATAERVEAIVGRDLELAPAAGIAAVTPGLARGDEIGRFLLRGVGESSIWHNVSPAGETLDVEAGGVPKTPPAAFQ
jgi:hypothetical protein